MVGLESGKMLKHMRQRRRNKYDAAIEFDGTIWCKEGDHISMCSSCLSIYHYVTIVLVNMQARTCNAWSSSFDARFARTSSELHHLHCACDGATQQVYVLVITNPRTTFTLVSVRHLHACVLEAHRAQVPTVAATTARRQSEVWRADAGDASLVCHVQGSLDRRQLTLQLGTWQEEEDFFIV